MKKYSYLIFLSFTLLFLLSCDNHQHSYTDGTCISKQACSICGDTLDSFGPHQMVIENSINPTCESNGVIIEKCMLCGYENQITLEKLEHNYDSNDCCINCKLHKYEDVIPSNEPSYKELTELISNKYLPDDVTSNLEFPDSLPSSSARVYWMSSNQNIISRSGVVNRGNSDKKVTITVSLVFGGTTLKYMKNVTVKAIKLKDINNKKLVIAYFYPTSSTDVNSEDLEKIDVINYSFGTISNTNIVIPDEAKFKKVLAYHNQGVRISLAIGGWGAGGFSEALMNKTSRTALVNSIMQVIIKYNLDGIDIDWEYPTSSVAGIKSDPADRSNLTYFCEELSKSMKAYRKDLLLTLAITSSNKFYDLKKLSEYVDYFNVMTYDFAMGNEATHLTNLYGTSTSADNSIKYVLQYVPSSKVIIGAAFYGRYATFDSSSSKTIGSHLSTSLASGSISYTKIKENIVKNGWIELWDESAYASYIIHDDIFVTYDSPRSVAYKANYVLDNSLGGIMFWDLSQDTTGDLLNAIDEVFNK